MIVVLLCSKGISEFDECANQRESKYKRYSVSLSTNIDCFLFFKIHACFSNTSSILDI